MTPDPATRRPPYVVLMFAWWFGGIARIGGTFALVVVASGWSRGDAARSITVLPFCGLAGWAVGLGYDAVVSRLICPDKGCACRAARGPRLVRALECASPWASVEAGPDNSSSGFPMPWMWRALRWFEVLAVVALLLMFAWSVVTKQPIKSPR